MTTRVLKAIYHEVWTDAAPISGGVLIQTDIPVIGRDPAELSRMEAILYLDSVVGAPVVSKPTFAVNPTTGFLDVLFAVNGGQVAYTLDIHYHQPQGVDATYAGLGVVVTGGAISGGGGAVTGSPSALVYINLLGTGHLTDPGLTAAPPDALGRPQIHDVRVGVAPGSFCVWRQGAWVVEGDLINAEGNGVVIFGSSGTPIDPTHGTKTWLKQRSLSYENMDPAINGGAIYSQMKLDWTGLAFRNNAVVPLTTFNVSASNGDLSSEGQIVAVGNLKTQANVAANGTVEGITALKTGTAPAVATIRAGAGVPTGVVNGVPGDLYLNTLGGANTTLWVNETGGPGGWVAK